MKQVWIPYSVRLLPGSLSSSLKAAFTFSPRLLSSPRWDVCDPDNGPVLGITRQIDIALAIDSAKVQENIECRRIPITDRRTCFESIIALINEVIFPVREVQSEADEKPPGNVPFHEKLASDDVPVKSASKFVVVLVPSSLEKQSRAFTVHIESGKKEITAEWCITAVDIKRCTYSSGVNLRKSKYVSLVGILAAAAKNERPGG